MGIFKQISSPLGKIILISDGKCLTNLWLEGQYTPDNCFKFFESPDNDVLNCTERWLNIYFSGGKPDFIPNISIACLSPFRRRVCEILLSIPYGQLTTYGSIAKQIEKETGTRVSAQAVGGAVGHNPISIIIPCHRVIGANGNLTGYTGGIDKKIALLKIEGIDVNKYKRP